MVAIANDGLNLISVLIFSPLLIAEVIGSQAARQVSH
jgi:hypothetical protein